VIEKVHRYHEQSDIAPVLRREIPDPPWGWGSGPIGDDAVPARAVASAG
jgi:hypothetical protein